MMIEEKSESKFEILDVDNFQKLEKEKASSLSFVEKYKNIFSLGKNLVLKEKISLDEIKIILSKKELTENILVKKYLIFYFSEIEDRSLPVEFFLDVEFSGLDISHEKDSLFSLINRKIEKTTTKFIFENIEKISTLGEVNQTFLVCSIINTKSNHTLNDILENRFFISSFTEDLQMMLAGFKFDENLKLDSSLLEKILDISGEHLQLTLVENLLKEKLSIKFYEDNFENIMKLEGQAKYFINTHLEGHVSFEFWEKVKDNPDIDGYTIVFAKPMED